MIYNIVDLLSQHPICSAIMLFLGATIWIFWLFLAYAIHLKNKNTAVNSFFRRSIPILMICVPCWCVAILFEILATPIVSRVPYLQSRPAADCLSYIDDNGTLIGVIDGDYPLVVKFIDNKPVSLGIVVNKSDGLHTYRLNLSTDGLQISSPTNSPMSLMPYGVHSIPNFTGDFLENTVSEPKAINFSSFLSPTSLNELNEYFCPVYYIHVVNGYGTVQCDYLSSDKVGNFVLLYGHWTEPIITWALLHKLDKKQIYFLLTTIYPQFKEEFPGLVIK